MTRHKLETLWRTGKNSLYYNVFYTGIGSHGSGLHTLSMFRCIIQSLLDDNIVSEFEFINDQSMHDWLNLLGANLVPIAIES